MTQDQRDHTEFTRLYEGCAGWLYGYLLSLLRRPLDAEEVLQETASLLWEKFDQFHPGTEFRAWACRVAYFKVLKFRESRAKSPLSFSDLFLERVDQEAVVMADKLDARSAALEECIKKLPRDDRGLLREHYDCETTVTGVATSRGCSVHVVYRALARIRDVLHRCINRTLMEESGG